MKEINKNIRKVDTKLSIAEVNKIAKETAKALGSDFSVTKDSVDTASFDLDYMGEEYDGGSYLIMDNGDVVNVALPEKQVAYNYKTNKKFEFGGDFQAGVYAGGGGVGLIGNQKRIDMNHNGKIDAEDFKILRSTMNGAWRNERKHVNHNEDYEIRYAKTRPARKGYKGKRNFDDGGEFMTDPTFGNFQNNVYAGGGAVKNERKHVNHSEDYEIRYAKPRPSRKGYKGTRKFNEGGKVTSFTNKDGIRVRSKVEPKEKMSEKEWMAKHNSSKEARSYMSGGSIRDIKWANADNKKLGVWLLTSVDGNAILNKSKNASELEKNVMDYYKKRGSVARMTWDDDADDGLSWVTFTDLYNEIKSYYMAGGKTSSKKEATEVKKGKGNHKMKATTDLARKIRKEGEKWTDAIKRASQQMKIN